MKLFIGPKLWGFPLAGTGVKLSAVEQFAQLLLLTNEVMYVD